MGGAYFTGCVSDSKAVSELTSERQVPMYSLLSKQ